MRASRITAEEAIGRYKLASVRREFPGQFIRSTLEEIEAAAHSGDRAATRALKLLFSRKFDKR
jgi:hypothetical protein